MVNDTFLCTGLRRIMAQFQRLAAVIDTDKKFIVNILHLVGKKHPVFRITPIQPAQQSDAGSLIFGKKRIFKVRRNLFRLFLCAWFHSRCVFHV